MQGTLHRKPLDTVDSSKLIGAGERLAHACKAARTRSTYVSSETKRTSIGVKGGVPRKGCSSLGKRDAQGTTAMAAGLLELGFDTI